MSAEEQQLMMIRGLLASMPPEDQEKVKAAEQALRKVMEEYGDHSALAIALIGAEMAAKG